MNAVALVVEYIRVSTREQALKGYSPAVQEDSIKQYAARFFDGEPYEEAVVPDIGGKGGVGLRQHPDIFPKYRKGLSNAIDVLMAEAGKRPLHFIALDQSRLEREPLLWHLLESVYMERHGIIFHFAHDGGIYRPRSAESMGRGVQSLANQNHLHSTGRRVSENNEHRARQGYHNGSPPFGWRKVDSRDGLRRKDLEPVPELAEILHFIRSKVLEGWGAWRVAQQLEAQGVPSPSGNRKWYPETVTHIARDPMHAGYIRWKSESIRGRHYDLRLWDIEVTNELDRVITQRHRSAKRGVMLKDFLVAGMLTCGHCHRPLASAYDSGTGACMYRCNGRLVPFSSSHKGINRVAGTVEKAVVEEIRRVLSTEIVHNLTKRALEEASETELANIQREEQRLRHQLDEAGCDLAEVIQQYRKRELSEAAYQSVKNRLEIRLATAEKRLAEVKKRREYLGGNSLRLARAREAVTRFRDLWGQLDVEERRGVLQALLAEIVVLREGRNLRLHFRYHFLPETEVLLRPMKGTAGSDGIEQLSQRELAVLHLRHQGLPEQDIAEQMGITRNCLRQHCFNIRRRLSEPDLDKCCALVESRIETELLFLPLHGRMNKRPEGAPLISPQEQVVLAAVDGGETYDDLAKRLAKSKNSVYNMVYNARRKLREQEAKARQIPREVG
jgi:DNA-binding NarL/FixJ family response regulator/DNA invertase Pin-like site-specific DNA recombinase